MRFRQKNGGVVWGNVAASLVRDLAGNPTGTVAMVLDITQQKKAEENLRRSKERLGLAVDGARLGTWNWNLNSDEITWSDRGLAALGFKPEDGPVMNYARAITVLHPDDRDKLEKEVRLAIENRGDFSMDYRVCLPDGSQRWIHSKGRVYCDEDGTPARMDGVVLDITDRKRADAALRESEYKYRVLFESSRDAIIIADETGHCYDCNSAAVETFGCADKRQLLDLGMVGLSPERQPDGLLSRDVFKRNAAEVLAAGGLFEFQHRRADGTLFPAEASVNTIQIQGRRLLHGVVRDISDRKQAEEDLRTLTQTLEQRVVERTVAIQMLYDIAAMANSAKSTDQAIMHCLRKVATYSDWRFGHALLPTADIPDQLAAAFSWYGADLDKWLSFRDATFSLHFRRGQDLPGRVLASGKLEWSNDVRQDLERTRAALAAELGIKTSVAFPVPLGDKIVAVLEFFSDRVIEPGSQIAAAMVGVGLQLGRVIERNQFEEHLLAIADHVQLRVAQDLHDDIGQELTGLRLQTAVLAKGIPQSAQSIEKIVGDIAAALDRTHNKVRKLCQGMLPYQLEQGCLAGALNHLAAVTSENSQVRCEFSCLAADQVFDERVSAHLYRIAQEAIANALRHGKATSILVSLIREGEEAVLRIEDNGSGLAGSSVDSQGMGLRIMRYRASLLGAKLEIYAAPAGGTRVVCRVDAERHKSQQNLAPSGWF